ncbi:MAG: RagB/SusD family nutrient uptake outer membrane protein [Bacteroidales bacterium]|nr:RagB/SusD family nutrient uptake outer membrane protein [Bacteroidales bacterium]MBN2817993.1 RagB/SusD family nutrient uptake outer membrane protein [Bacteroidales bacterium]
MKISASRNKIKIFLALGACLLWNTGCNDWIDIEPENELIKQEFWKTSDDINSVIAATYDALRGTMEKSLLMGEVRADFISISGGIFGDYERIAASDISTTNGVANWSSYYNVINLANTVMHYAPIVQKEDKTLTDEVIDDIKSEMLFLRALNYFYLVRLWKDVPLVLSPTVSDTVEFYLPKSEERVVLNQIVSDLKVASALAFTDKFANDISLLKGRANKYAIQALMADVLLWSERYNECITYCDSIMNSGALGLEPSNDWFKIYYPGNSRLESIFELQYDDDFDGQENPIYVSLLNSLSVNLSYIDYDRQNDIRMSGSKGPLWKYVGTDETGLNQKKRTDNERDANFIYYRYADILFIKAEALAETGNFEEANYLVRLIAERAGVSYTPTFSLVNFRNTLLAERGREFAAEGKRWYDVLRFAKKNHFENKQLIMDMLLSKATDAQKLAVMRSKVVDTMSYYLPIHYNEIQVNKKLVQNPFYDR